MSKGDGMDELEKIIQDTVTADFKKLMDEEWNEAVEACIDKVYSEIRGENCKCQSCTDLRSVANEIEKLKR